ncbi:hypothetical protein V5799_000910 [Amblyomma americanum]|uniref:Kelch repeat protein n=1 Tax=Amblyomma americanum TaxID=6943 RepID=A0AAQ4D1P6_AMBAM
MWTVRLEGGPRRVNLAVVAVDDKICSLGGHCTGEDYANRTPIDVHTLDTVPLRWTPLQTESNRDVVPFKRYGHTVVFYADCVYLWGGRDDNGPCNTLYCFDTNAKVWTPPKVCGQVPWPRDGHSACVIGKRMFVFGGL